METLPDKTLNSSVTLTIGMPLNGLASRPAGESMHVNHRLLRNAVALHRNDAAPTMGDERKKLSPALLWLQTGVAQCEGACVCVSACPCVRASALPLIL